MELIFVNNYTILGGLVKCTQCNANVCVRSGQFLKSTLNWIEFLKL